MLETVITGLYKARRHPYSLAGWWDGGTYTRRLNICTKDFLQHTYDEAVKYYTYYLRKLDFVQRYQISASSPYQY
jgi:hypothetical protein